LSNIPACADIVAASITTATSSTTLIRQNDFTAASWLNGSKTVGTPHS
jgi:hypothetical protein